MSIQPDLLPCPFCGGPVSHTGAAIRCNSFACHASMSPRWTKDVVGAAKGDWASTRELAVADTARRWNGRADLASVQQVRAYAQEAIIHAINDLSTHLETYHDSEEESREAGNIWHILHHLEGTLIGMDDDDTALTPAPQPEGQQVRGEWNRSDNEGSILLYTLKQDGWRKGEPIMVNDLTIRIENANGSSNDLTAIAENILAALTPSPQHDTNGESHER